MDSYSDSFNSAYQSNFENSSSDDDFFDAAENADDDKDYALYDSPREVYDGAGRVDTVDAFGCFKKEDEDDPTKGVFSSKIQTLTRGQIKHRCVSPVLQEEEFPTYTQTPTVLADLPHLCELYRTSDATFAAKSNAQVRCSLAAWIITGFCDLQTDKIPHWCVGFKAYHA